MTLIPVDAQQAEKRRKAAEKVQRYGNWKSAPKANRTGLPFAQYPFVMWDGEATQDAGYCLFGSSEGHEICHPYLTTDECFELLLDAKREMPESIFVIFGSRYDWDEICRQSMPLDRLSRLEFFGTVTWHGYTVRKMPGKIFSITKGGCTVRVFETFGWFKCRYTKALRDYQIGTEEQLSSLESDKNRRNEFLWQDISDIRLYMRLELALGPPLMERIREIVHAAGFRPRSWYGPSALATELLSRNKISQYMAESPPHVLEAARYAYCAGRFEMIQGGIIEQPTYTYDMNSAYMRAALELPDLAHGTWRKGKQYEPGKFALYRIRYKASDKGNFHRAYPLFRRLKNGNVTWHRKVTGWYWSPEAALVADDPDATFLEAWVFDEDDTAVRPFAFVQDLYERRLVLKRLPVSNPSRVAEIALKWALAAIYGQLARRVGWDRFRRKAPRNHQLEWAGYITSWCKAEMYKVARQCRDEDLISIDTDSVTALVPLDVPLGDKLGEWKMERHDGGVFFQSGVYYLRDGDDWTQGRTRGIEQRKGKPLVSAEMLMEAVRTGSTVQLKPKRRYVSVRMGLNGKLSSMGDWNEHPADKLSLGGAGKRGHAKCRHLCRGDRHWFYLPPLYALDGATGENILEIFQQEPTSVAHPLPWLERDYLDKELTLDILWVDPDKIDQEDYWLVELVNEQQQGTASTGSSSSAENGVPSGQLHAV